MNPWSKQQHCVFNIMDEEINIIGKSSSPLNAASGNATITIVKLDTMTVSLTPSDLRSLIRSYDNFD